MKTEEIILLPVTVGFWIFLGGAVLVATILRKVGVAK